MTGFTPSAVEKNFFADSISANMRGTTVSVKDTFGPRYTRAMIGDTKVHDANFAFLTTTLAKLHKELHEPKYFVTWNKDIDADLGGGFVDYVEYYTVDWSGLVDEFRSIIGNNANYIPRINAALSQNRAQVFTFEVAYDLRFIDLEKMKQLTLQKSIQEIYENIIVAEWDLFVQRVAYQGSNANGLFTSDTKVKTTTIYNASIDGTAVKGFDGMTDSQIVAWFNSVFETYLEGSDMNISLLPDTFLVPTFVSRQLSERFSALYTSSLRSFLVEHNMGTAESDGKLKVRIEGRPGLNAAGTLGFGRIVAYRKDKQFVRIDMPYPMQHYITLPNIEKMAYTSAFVGQVSEIQMPYNLNNTDLGIVTYWDFTNQE